MRYNNKESGIVGYQRNDYWEPMMNIIIRDINFENKMILTVQPFLLDRMENGFFSRHLGEPIYYEHYKAENPIGTVVIIHGFSESAIKYYETIYYFLNSSYDVWIMEQRGHGRSFKSFHDPNVIHIENYNDLVEDMYYFVVNCVIPGSDPELPLNVFAHSMGGAVAACFLERYPDIFSHAVLSSPMLKLNSGIVPYGALYVAVRTTIQAGRGRDPLPGSSPLPDHYDPSISLCTCRQRDEYFYHMRRSSPQFIANQPSCQTTYQFHLIASEAAQKVNAMKVSAKVLLLQAEKDSLVRPHGQHAFIRSVKDGKLVKLRDTRHEIYISNQYVLRQYWKLIRDHLGS